MTMQIISNGKIEMTGADPCFPKETAELEILGQITGHQQDYPCKKHGSPDKF